MTLLKPLTVSQRTGGGFHGHDETLPVGAEVKIVARGFSGMLLRSEDRNFYYWPTIHGDCPQLEAATEQQAVLTAEELIL